jgi:cytochrome P450
MQPDSPVQVDRFDLRTLPAAFYDDPYPTYRELQRSDPIRRMPDDSLFVTRHADLVAVYRDTTTFSSDKRREFTPKFGAGTPLFEHHTTSLVFNDAPLHTNVRRLIVGALTVRAIAAMEPALVRLVDGLLDAAEARGTIDAIDDFAAAIPVEVIGNLLDVPQADRAPLRDWSLAILGALEPALTQQQLARGHQAVREFVDYLRMLVAERRRHPGDPAKDVLTRLIMGEGQERLDETTLLQNCIFILNAGHETTTNLIGNALEALLRFPDQRDRLLAEPQLIRSAIEEFLRFESSNQFGNRIAVAPATIGGVPVAAGTQVTLCIGAANRDPAVFTEPDRLDLAREPNRHLAFGLGVHQCAGLTLARLEARVAIQRFVTRFPRYEPAGPPIRGGRARFRGFLALPMRVT